jgi:triosephosphate isomerase
MRKKLVAANWKMHKTIAESQAFVETFLPQVQRIQNVEIALAPPFTALAAVAAALRNSAVRLAAQDVHSVDQGAYTGAISARMLRDVGCTYVIVGHSERRQHFHEDDRLIQKKLVALFSHELMPILCVGETFEERRVGSTDRVLERQLRADLAEICTEHAGRLVIAYEPVWAIGTGETASPPDAENGASLLRSLLREMYDPATAESTRILYGGSVKPDNAQTLMAQPNVDGVLVGTASRDPAQFAEIVKAAARTVSHA